MATLITKSIGATSRDYATITLWIAAIPANLVTADQVWKGECYNDGIFTERPYIYNITTDTTRYVWLTVASGHRHDGKRYKTSGVRVTDTYSYGAVVRGDACKYAIIEWLQVYPSGGQAGIACNNSPSEDITVRNCIVYYVSQQSGYYSPGISGTGSSTYIYNNLVYGNLLYNGIEVNYGSKVYNNTVYSRTGTSDYGIHGNDTARNNISMLNAGACYSGFTVGTFSNNLSSDTTGNAGLQSKVATDIFTSVSSGSEDFTLKAGGSAIGAGVDLSSVFTNDIVGTTRTSPWDIGAWKYSNPFPVFFEELEEEY